MAVSANTGPRPVYDVPFLNSFTVDGDPAERGTDGFRVSLVGVNRDEQRLVAADDIDVSLRLGWTQDGLAVLLEVRDDEYLEDPFDHRLGQGDHFAMNVADSIEGRNMVTVVVSPGMAADQPELRYTVRDHRAKELRSVPAEASVARAKRADGYVAAVLVPWAMLGVTPERGREIGFQLNMRDWDKAGPSAIVTWFPYLRNWRPKDNLHALRLWTAASPAFEQTAVASVDYVDLRRARYRVGCRKADAGKTVSILSRGKVLAQSSAHAEGESAVAHLEGAYPPVGSEDEVQEIRIGDCVGATAFVRARGGRRIAAAMREQVFPCSAFSGESFPPCDFADRQSVRELLGECTVSVQFYDEECRLVEKALSEGRYGAAVTVTTGGGVGFAMYRTLWRTPEASGAVDGSRVADAIWWAGLKKQVGLPEEAILDGLPEWDEVGGEFAGQFYRPARVLTRCLEFLGDPARAVETMSVSGASWRLLWDEGRWEPGISAMCHFGHLVEERRVFSAIGREHTFLGKREEASGKGHTEDEMRALICAEIDAGRPVIGCGLEGPGELAVAGYKEGGRVLLVAWGAGKESCQEVKDWHSQPDFAGFHIIGGSKPAPSARDKLIGALKLAVDMARTPQVNGRACGLAAYDAWARDLLRDEHFPAKDTESLRHVAWSSGEAALAHVDARAAAIKYLRSAQRHVGEEAGKHLAAAAELHEKEWHAVMDRHDHMPWGGERGADLLRVTTRENREALAKGVREAKEHYGQAIEHIEKALGAEGVDLRARGVGARTPGEEHTERGGTMERTADRLETERLVIRRFTRDDWAEIQSLAIDKESSEAGKYDHRWPTSEDGCKGMAEYLSKNGCFWAVCPKQNRRIIGLLSFNGIEEDGRLELGHVFHRDFARDDLDTEAIRCVIDHAFAVLDVQCIVCRNAADWTVQLAPLKKLGLRMKGRGKASLQQDEKDNPIEFTWCEMEITKEEWLRRTKREGPKAEPDKEQV